MKLLEIARRNVGNGITIRFSVSEFCVLTSALGDLVAQHQGIGKKEEKRLFHFMKKISEQADEFIRNDQEFAAKSDPKARKVFYAEWDKETQQ